MDVEFYEPKYQSTGISSNPKGIVGWLIRMKWVKNTKQANFILLIFILLSLSISFYLINQAISLGSDKNVIYKEDLTPDQIKQIPPEFYRNIPSRNDKNKP